MFIHRRLDGLCFQHCEARYRSSVKRDLVDEGEEVVTGTQDRTRGKGGGTEVIAEAWRAQEVRAIRELLIVSTASPRAWEMSSAGSKPRGSKSLHLHLPLRPSRRAGDRAALANRPCEDGQGERGAAMIALARCRRYPCENFCPRNFADGKLLPLEHNGCDCAPVAHQRPLEGGLCVIWSVIRLR
jgi:hypothetical protein